MANVLNLRGDEDILKKVKKYNISDDESDNDEDTLEEEEEEEDIEDDLSNEDEVFYNNDNENKNRKKEKKSPELTSKSKKNHNDNVAHSSRENKKSTPSKRKSNTYKENSAKKLKVMDNDNKKDLNNKKLPKKVKSDENVKKKNSEESSNFKMDKKFYNQILYKIKSNEEYSSEVKERLMTDINDIGDTDYETYLQLNFSHQKNGQMICAQRPPPLKHGYTIKILENIIKYFSSNDVEEEQTGAKNFLNELKQVTKHDYKKMYDILTIYFYGYEAFVSYNLTKYTFHPEDPLIDFDQKIIPINQISLNKRSNQKFNVRNDDKRFMLLKNLVHTVIKQINDFNREETINDNILDFLILCDIQKSFNCHDTRVSKNLYLAGLVFLISFLCDIVLFGCRRLSFKKKAVNK